MAKGKGNKSRGRQQNNHKSKKDGGKERQTKKRDEESNDEESEDEVDYAAGADAFASDYSGDEGEEANGDISSDDDESEQGSGSNVEDSSDDDDDSEEEQEDVTAVFKGVVMQNDDSEGDSNEYDDDKSASSSEDDDESKARQVSKATKNKNVDKGSELCTFDLRNLVAMNSHQIASNSLVLSQKKKKSANSSSGNLTIPSNDHGNVVNEEFLLAKATEGCTQLVQALWQLPTEKSDAGPLVELPSYDEIRLPRSLVSMHIREYFLDSC